MIFPETDKKIIRELALRYREAAESEDNRKAIERSYRTNDLAKGRPFVSAEEIPWVEMNVDGLLTNRCEHPFARELETFFRRELLRYDFFRTDHVMLPAYMIDKAYDNTGFGLTIRENTRVKEEGNNIISHYFLDVLPDEKSLDQIHPMTITPRPDLDEQKVSMAEELLSDTLPVRLRGMTYFYFAPWDQLVRYHGVENTFMDLHERPEFLHEMLERYMAVHLDYLDQMEKYGLLDNMTAGTELHCTALYTKALPGAEAGAPKSTKSLWLRCTAQAFGYCSPEFYNEFEIEPVAKMRARFAQTYYGCCEPLQNVLPYLLPHPEIRKLGVSPFADLERCAEQIGGDHILSRKAHPGLLAGGFSEENIRNEIAKTAEVCERYGCSYDYVLKDLSTVDHKPERLFIWAKTVREYLDSVYGD